eukprot:TRINITY_DN13560_c0_g1_i1.p1 TRINITY_DN13560_c0_g1~~TRINITY_DN13560_c0_g1_i1.p1  ORF type:complete len:349 (+),score=63.87 TRINITY_DN13560_c0_g1_i1:40-1086(+)
MENSLTQFEEKIYQHICDFDEKFNLGKHQEAIEEATKVIELLNENSTYRKEIANMYISRASAFARMGKYKEAVEDYNNAIDRDSTNSEGICYRGYGYMQLQNYEKAMKDFTDAISMNPTGRNYMFRANLYKELKQYEYSFEDNLEASSILTHQIKKKGPNRYLLHDRGTVYRNLKQYKNAIHDFSVAIQFVRNSDNNSGLTNFLNARGQTFIKIELFKNAFNDFNQVLAIHPDNWYALEKIGKIYSLLKHYKKSVEYYKKAISLNPNLYKLYYHCASSYYHLKEYSLSLELLSSCLSIRSDFTKASMLVDKILLLQKEQPNQHQQKNQHYYFNNHQFESVEHISMNID